MGILSSILGNAGVVAPDKIETDYAQLLAEGETIEVGFAVFRDTFIFTDKRLMIVDGRFDLDAELKIWVGSDTSPIQKKFNKKVNIYDLQRVLAQFTLA
jgi:hypothetical protein